MLLTSLDEKLTKLSDQVKPSVLIVRRQNRRSMAPIDPLQLLRALSPLLSPDGGIKSVEEVARLSSLMKKFSRKLVSRCVYVNVLRASTPETVEAFLQKGGWETIYQWLQEAKKSENSVFLVELMKLYKILPMTVERLKENNSAKILKVLTKNGLEDIRVPATHVVNAWMELVKGGSNDSSTKNDTKDVKVVKKKKRKEEKKPEKEKESSTKKESTTKKEEKLGSTTKTNSSSGNKTAKPSKENNKSSVIKEELEDVKLPDYIRITADPLPPLPIEDTPVKKERKSTVKTYRAKMRSIGLDEPTPLPKPATKKAVTNANRGKVSPLPPLKTTFKRIGPILSRDALAPPLKKLKPPTLVIPKNEPNKSPSSASGTTVTMTTTTVTKPDTTAPPQKLDAERREIKLIPPRPKPAVHVLTESAGFMDALVATPSQPIRKKKKLAPGKSPPTPTTPPSPVTVAPKLQFYKDTLETNEEIVNGDDKGAAVAATDSDEINQSNAEEEGTTTSITDNIDRSEETLTPASPDAKADAQTKERRESSSSLTSIRKKKKRKSVSWAEESNLKQIHYFEMDETERVNVNNVKNFGDMKTLERLNERQMVESTRRRMDDDHDHRMAWLLVPVDMPPLLIVPGANSLERDIQKQREESVLQEIFFSKESIPDAPHEPDPEFFDPEEPKIIPLEDENNPDAVVDYSTMEPPAPVTSLPAALSNLVMSLSGKTTGFGSSTDGEPNTNSKDVKIPGLGELPPMPHGPPAYDPMGFPMGPMGPMGMGPTFYNGPRGPMPGPHPPYGYPQGGPMMRHHGPMRGGPTRGNPYTRGGNGPNHQWGNGGGGGRDGGSNRGYRGGNRGEGRDGGGGGGNRGPPRTTCRHFMAGSCKYQENCTFLHPGINGPML